MEEREAAGLVRSAEEKPKSKDGGAPFLFSFGRMEKIRGGSGGAEEAALVGAHRRVG